ncbi:DNA-directed RNA polymerase subunit beta [Paenibacillus sp. ACRRX]|uniref:DNA-directed RNA polymerase subunit beta n=1 Tax=Paenibacillus sp. ACRRX TaxID=2918206 RepID=UPI001EF4E7D5|nr:DNA-directed RNA polymerase subunit beta [Paenibacillus sp. ACRRX]
MGTREQHEGLSEAGDRGMSYDEQEAFPNQRLSRSDRTRSTSTGQQEDDNHLSSNNSDWEKAGKKSSAMKWVFRLLITPMLCILTAYAGMVIGLVVLGHGTVGEALNFSTWTHLFRLVFG